VLDSSRGVGSIVRMLSVCMHLYRSFSLLIVGSFS
jgi:hypothetical protein